MEEYQSVKAARYTNKLRNGVEILGKASIIGNTIFTLIIHGYAAILLLISNIFIEIILPTLIFDICFCGGCIWLWIIAGKGTKGDRKSVV